MRFYTRPHRHDDGASIAITNRLQPRVTPVAVTEDRARDTGALADAKQNHGSDVYPFSPSDVALRTE
jgi:hypothetical protein